MLIIDYSHFNVIYTDKRHYRGTTRRGKRQRDALLGPREISDMNKTFCCRRGSVLWWRLCNAIRRWRCWLGLVQ